VKDVAVAAHLQRRYVSVDGGMSDNIRTALYGAEYDVRLVSRASDAPPVLARIVGKHCESGDIVVRDTWVNDDIHPGDLVAVAALAARIGAPLTLRGVGVRRIAADRGVPIELLTDDVDELISRDDVDVVVELMGPVEPAHKAILGALERGKSVVTANKALLAQ